MFSRFVLNIHPQRKIEEGEEEVEHEIKQNVHATGNGGNASKHNQLIDIAYIYYNIHLRKHSLAIYT